MHVYFVVVEITIYQYHENKTVCKKMSVLRIRPRTVAKHDIV